MPLYRDLLFGAKSVSTLGVLIAIHAFPSVAVACTFCHSDTARQVRAGIFRPDFGFHVFVGL